MEKTYQCFVMIKTLKYSVYSNLTETLVSKHKHQTMTAIKMCKHVKIIKKLFKKNTCYFNEDAESGVMESTVEDLHDFLSRCCC